MYNFKRLEEVLWFGLVGAGIAVLEALIRLDEKTLDDWQTWAIAVSGAAIRAFAGAVLAALTKPK